MPALSFSASSESSEALRRSDSLRVAGPVDARCNGGGKTSRVRACVRALCGVRSSTPGVGARDVTTRGGVGVVGGGDVVNTPNSLSASLSARFCGRPAMRERLPRSVIALQFAVYGANLGACLSIRNRKRYSFGSRRHFVGACEVPNADGTKARTAARSRRVLRVSIRIVGVVRGDADGDQERSPTDYRGPIRSTHARGVAVLA